jgi:hypothetical protein
MSEENVELQHRVIDDFNRRDLDAYLALVDPDIEYLPRIRELEGGGPYHGHAAIRAGGRACSASPPTSTRRSRTYETSET